MPDGFLNWLELCGWTFDPRRPENRRSLPFLPWPVQRTAGANLWQAIQEGHDVLIDKSRDMGATWLCLAAFAWFWLFVPQTPLLAASRKEEYVDGRGNPDTLFWKLDYLIGRLPGWLRPRMDRRHMHLGNMNNGSVIDGESTNADLGRGGRRKAILLDEFGVVENGGRSSRRRPTRHAAGCSIARPRGRANAFAEERFSGKVQVVTLHWKDHPEKGKGAALAVGADGKQHWTSPWYEAECARRTSKKEIAQELDIDYLASGGAFFDLDVLQRIRVRGSLKAPLHRGDIVGGKFVARTGGRLLFWCEIAPDQRQTLGRGFGARPNPRHGLISPDWMESYCGFADISHGTGASNSVLAIACDNTREVAGLLVAPDMPPHEFARTCVDVLMWFGGVRTPCWAGRPTAPSTCSAWRS